MEKNKTQTFSSIKFSTTKLKSLHTQMFNLKCTAHFIIARLKYTLDTALKSLNLQWARLITESKIGTTNVSKA